jgi:hypothetical protein
MSCHWPFSRGADEIAGSRDASRRNPPAFARWRRDRGGRLGATPISSRAGSDAVTVVRALALARLPDLGMRRDVLAAGRIGPRRQRLDEIVYGGAALMLAPP